MEDTEDGSDERRSALFSQSLKFSRAWKSFLGCCYRGYTYEQHLLRGALEALELEGVYVSQEKESSYEIPSDQNRQLELRSAVGLLVSHILCNSFSIT